MTSTNKARRASDGTFERPGASCANHPDREAEASVAGGYYGFTDLCRECLVEIGAEIFVEPLTTVYQSDTLGS